MELKHAIQKCSHLHTALVATRDAGNRALSYPCFLLERMRPRREGPIRVVYIVQMPSVWNKAKPTYMRMLADPDFEPIILCLPSSLENCFDRENETYRYFLDQGYTSVINAVLGETWLPPKSLNADYFVIMRPYDNYRPKPYKSINLCKYGKICVILYASIMTRNLVSDIISRGFFSQVSYFFAESEYLRDYNIHLNLLKHSLGLQHSVLCGMSAIEFMLNAKDLPAKSWEFSHNSFRVIWTPRWSTDTVGGGSNFFRYQQCFFSFFSLHQDIDLLIRPHPLMFHNFLSSGIMTQKEIDSFCSLCDEQNNISLDQEEEYIPSFWNSDVLVSDISGIIPEYFVTGKPIVFCSSKGIDWLFMPTIEEMMAGCYHADSFADIERILGDLQQGNDPLKETRAVLVRKLFPTDLPPSETIVNMLRKGG